MNGRWPSQIAAQTGQTGPKRIGSTPSLFDSFGPQPASSTPWAPTMSVPSARTSASPGGSWERQVNHTGQPGNTFPQPSTSTGTGWEGPSPVPGPVTTFPDVVPPLGSGPGWEGPPGAPPITLPTSPGSGPTNSPGWPGYTPPGAQTIGSSFWSGDTLSVPTSSSEFGPLRQGLMQWLSSQMSGVNAGAPNATQSMSQLGPGSEFYNHIVDQLNPAFAQRRGLALAQAKEAAGNLTGSSYGNALGSTVNRSLLDENQQILDYATGAARSEQQRQAADADRAANVGNANAGRITDLFGRLGTAGVGTNEIAQTGGAGAIIPAILGLFGQGSGGGSNPLSGFYNWLDDALGGILPGGSSPGSSVLGSGILGSPTPAFGGGAPSGSGWPSPTPGNPNPNNGAPWSNPGSPVGSPAGGGYGPGAPGGQNPNQTYDMGQGVTAYWNGSALGYHGPPGQTVVIQGHTITFDANGNGTVH